MALEKGTQYSDSHAYELTSLYLGMFSSRRRAQWREGVNIGHLGNIQYWWKGALQMAPFYQGATLTVLVYKRSKLVSLLSLVFSTVSTS